MLSRIIHWVEGGLELEIIYVNYSTKFCAAIQQLQKQQKFI